MNLEIKYDSMEEFKFLKIGNKLLALVEDDTKSRTMKFKEINETETQRLINSLTDKITEAVYDSINPAEFIRNAIKESIKVMNYSDMEKLRQKAEERKITVRRHKGCFALSIGESNPIELVISGDHKGVI